jgi:hypothetical protein
MHRVHSINKMHPGQPARQVWGGNGPPTHRTSISATPTCCHPPCPDPTLSSPPVHTSLIPTTTNPHSNHPPGHCRPGPPCGSSSPVSLPQWTTGSASSPHRRQRRTTHETSERVRRRWLSVPCVGTRSRAARLRRKLTSTDLTARHQRAAAATRPHRRASLGCFPFDPALHASCAMPWGVTARPFSIADERGSPPATGDEGHLLPGQPQCV